jgi:hypothetical protein
MGLIENLYPMRNSVRYVVASENESWSSYPYDDYLSEIDANTLPADLARRIVDRYHTSLEGGYPRTMAAFDLSYIEGVAQAVDSLANVLNTDDLNGYESNIKTSFQSVQKFDSNVDLQIDDRDAYIDLYHFASLLSQNISDVSVQEAAQAVMTAIGQPGEKLILDRRRASGIYNGKFWSLEHADGLSIYLPLGVSDWLLDYYNGAELSFAADTTWDEFIKSLVIIAQPPVGPAPEPIDSDHRPGPLPVQNKLFLPSLTN